MPVIYQPEPRAPLYVGGVSAPALTNEPRVLAHVAGLSEGAKRALAGTEPRVPGFPEWLDADHPRHPFLTDEISEVVTEWGAADASRIYRTYATQAEARVAVAEVIAKGPASIGWKSPEEDKKEAPATAISNQAIDSL